MNRYKIYPEINFAAARLAPRIQKFEEIYSFVQRQRNDKHFSDIYYQVIDVRGCTFQFDVSRIKDMVALIDSYSDKDNQKLIVYVVDQPDETAYLQLFFQLMPYKREYCSTMEEAYRFLRIPVQYMEFEKLFDV